MDVDYNNFRGEQDGEEIVENQFNLKEGRLSSKLSFLTHLNLSHNVQKQYLG